MVFFLRLSKSFYGVGYFFRGGKEEEEEDTKKNFFFFLPKKIKHKGKQEGGG